MAARLKKHLGFTGTREGLTPAQADTLAGLLEARQAGEVDGWSMHHGCCRGADATAHVIGLRLGWRIVGHPPIDDRWIAALALGDFDTWRAPAPYLDRNRAIVNESAELVACPIGPEKTHSGTWATTRYARRLRRPVTIIWPDGTVAFD